MGLLSVAIWLPIAVGALLLAVGRDAHASAVRWIALVGALAGFLVTVPLAITGALGLLQWTGGTLNVYSQIGLITLVGLITKHGILIVEFTHQLRSQGRALRESVVDAAVLVVVVVTRVASME